MGFLRRENGQFREDMTLGNDVDELGIMKRNEQWHMIYKTCISRIMCTDIAALILHPPPRSLSFRNGCMKLIYLVDSTAVV